MVSLILGRNARSTECTAQIERKKKNKKKVRRRKRSGRYKHVYSPHVRLIKTITTGRDSVTNKEKAEDGC